MRRGISRSAGRSIWYGSQRCGTAGHVVMTTGDFPSPACQEAVDARPAPVRILVLGPLEVLCDATPVAISGAKERALVVLLALHAGRVVPTETLIEALWEPVPPPSVEASLRVLVSRVRKALAAA